jgi:hypothetical protein
MKIKESDYVAVSYPLKLTHENDKFIDAMYSLSPDCSRNQVINILIEKGIEYFKREDRELSCEENRPQVKKVNSSLQFKRWFRVE